MYLTSYTRPLFSIARLSKTNTCVQNCTHIHVRRGRNDMHTAHCTCVRGRNARYSCVTNWFQREIRVFLSIGLICRVAFAFNFFFAFVAPTCLWIYRVVQTHAEYSYIYTLVTYVRTCQRNWITLPFIDRALGINLKRNNLNTVKNDVRHAKLILPIRDGMLDITTLSNFLNCF